MYRNYKIGILNGVSTFSFSFFVAESIYFSTLGFVYSTFLRDTLSIEVISKNCRTLFFSKNFEESVR